MAGTVKSGSKIASSLIGPQAWIALTPQNSWVNNSDGPNLQYRYWPLMNAIQVVGAISGGTITNGTIIGTGLTPHPNSQSTQVVQVSGNSAGPPNYPSITYTTSGTLTLWQIPTGTTRIEINLWFPLDS